LKCFILLDGDDSEVSIFVDLIMSVIGSGSVYHRGFGIKKRSWFGGGGRSRPAFMEPMPPGGPQGVPLGVPPPRDGNYVRSVGNGGGGGGGAGGGPLRVMRRSRSSSFLLKDDAGYIGYLSDDESVGGSGDEGEGGGGVMRVVDRRRGELIGSDISFSGCMLMMITVCGLLMLFIFAASPWGVPPPRRLYGAVPRGFRPPTTGRAPLIWTVGKNRRRICREICI
jgi:hypothetical protein